MTNIPDKTIKRKAKNDLIRFLTFNVNGIRTFFHYHPFSQMKSSLKDVFDYFDSDIISFQELKTDTLAISKWGKVDGFYSFISIPKVKKGYSGVGCWIRILPEDHPCHNTLKVVKAEEGITGLLTVKVNGQQIRYRDDVNLGLGGYDDLGITDEQLLLDLDSEGRCVMIELAYNMIVICVYSPANSGLTDEGEVFRMTFIKVLFNRIRNFTKMGKNVAFMGDINICRDLIDSADCLNLANINLQEYNTGTMVESKYYSDAVKFILNPDTPHRKLLNMLLSDSIIPELADDGILVDSTRYIQGRDRLKMYTVWNTLKNTRPSNYGSRIDLILLTDVLKYNIKDANILAEVMGSDHCPVYADLSFESISTEIKPSSSKIPKFEARYKFNLMNYDVLSMFAKRSKTAPLPRISNSSSASTSNTVKYGMAKKEKSIDTFFKITKTQRPNRTLSTRNAGPDKGISLRTTRISSSQSDAKSLKDIFGSPPLCRHGDVCILKTSKTSDNPGKKFWTCHKSRGDPNDPDSSCGFFKWV
ncbi:DNA-(apurinic or apyrimidinic site) lyase APN2 [Maudiozyma barnettii]|uniref:DNA-(apurinic or apyrimidinic site) endonuclease 2 n=1 Tax=Maudiozyma barnettii TaxID=61262 RepID=A0A8H2VBU8_9SACH|nr:DNA-(apurinic or apyrimidinic site) lyase APN2 [Kazachstania barnettii]CAB4252407.1 similar to Saccharomyces cerevisiae YBL019W APN2 Class II abasic (AP) endonuclease involved in repair of DNA damage [Kazachstania barnettii]